MIYSTENNVDCRVWETGTYVNFLQFVIALVLPSERRHIRRVQGDAPPAWCRRSILGPDSSQQTARAILGSDTRPGGSNQRNKHTVL